MDRVLNLKKGSKIDLKVRMRKNVFVPTFVIIKIPLNKSKAEFSLLTIKLC